MPNPQTLAVALLLLATATAGSNAQALRPPDLWGRLEAGPHAVGFRSLLVRDVSRPALTTETDSAPILVRVRGRQMQISIWYPARPSSQPAMTYERYVSALAQELDFAPLDDARRRRGIAKFFDMPTVRGGDTAALRRALPRILALRTAAVENARPASGRFPVVLFHDWRAPASNSVMAEYLASHGYVVAATGLKGTHSAAPDISAMGLETQVADLRFVVASVDSLPFVDTERLALIGVGIAASGALAFQMRTPAVDALVSLEGGITTPDEIAMIRRSPYYDVSHVRAPILAVTAPHPAVDANRLDVYRHATRHLVHFPRMGEFWFLDYGMLERWVPGIIGRAPGDTQLGFEWGARYVRRFLDAYLGGDAAAAAWIRRSPRAVGAPDDLLVAETRDGVPLGVEVERRAESPADTIPRLFGDGVISTGDNEFSTALTPDGRTVYWTVSAPNVFVIPFVILQATRVPQGWTTPRVAPFSGRGFSDADPAISADGQRIFFMSRRPVTGATQRPDFDIWVHDVATAATTRIDAINTDKQEIAPSVALDGTLYFTSDREGGFGGLDIYRSRLVGGQYAAPENLGAVVNTAHAESNVFVAPDQRFIIFSAAGRPDSRGGTDLYIAERGAGGAWTAARPMRYVNTEWDDYAPAVSPDGQTLYFTSRRPRAARAISRRLTYEDVQARFRSAGNGNADIYSIPLPLAMERN